MKTVASPGQYHQVVDCSEFTVLDGPYRTRFHLVTSERRSAGRTFSSLSTEVKGEHHFSLRKVLPKERSFSSTILVMEEMSVGSPSLLSILLISESEMRAFSSLST